MISITQGNILKSDAEALVNTVNCVGYMGKGIALQFKQAFPENFKAYSRACNVDKVNPGQMFVFQTGSMFNPKYIINFPTKRHWRGKSRIEDIEKGLIALVNDVKKLNIKSIAVPPLGCGLGGLNWDVVQPMIEKAFQEVPHVQLYLFAPSGAPSAKAMPINTSPPKMTIARALLLKLMDKYLELSYRLTLLEIHKLAYLLQEAGEPLRLRYEAGHYGPYAANLNKVLERIDSHFIRGYGDNQDPNADIEIIQKAVNEANEFLQDKNESKKRLKKVVDIIEGFETPYGVELLSTTHWVAKYNKPPASNENSAIEAFSNWNDRKRKMFKEKHIRIAWRRLESKSWITST
jgi:O-acetyl-ADP-ribose deacetylase (regulator of RNase III)